MKLVYRAIRVRALYSRTLFARANMSLICTLNLYFNICMCKKLRKRAGILRHGGVRTKTAHV